LIESGFSLCGKGDSLSWKSEAEKLWFVDGESWDEITFALMEMGYFPGRKFNQAKDAIRGYVRQTPQYKTTHQKELSSCPTGVIGDLHIPFEHPGYLQFCIDTFRKYNVKHKISIGDLFDHYCYSRFIKKPIAMNPKQEREMARKKIAPWAKAFPNLEIVMGNHDWRYIEYLENNGIDEDIIKDFKNIYNLSKTWKIYDEYDNLLIKDDVLYLHGTAYNGAMDAKSAAINEQMSVVMGHGHSFAGVYPIANKRKLMFGMNVGCGIDLPRYAFAYSKKDKIRPLLGCGIVYDSKFAIWIPMGAEYFRR